MDQNTSGDNPDNQPSAEQTSTPAKKPKLKSRLISLFIFLFFVLGIGGSLFGLVATGAINLGPIGNIFGGSPTVPDVEKMQSVCTEYGGTFKQQENQTMDSGGDTYATPYLCSSGDDYIFSVMIFNKKLLDILDEYRDRYADQIAKSEETEQMDLDSIGTFVNYLILADNIELNDVKDDPNYYKAVIETKSNTDKKTITYFQKAYVVAYDNAVITTMVNDDTSSEAILTALGANK